MEADVKHLLWEQIKDKLSIHTKVESILPKYKFTIQAYHGGTPTGVAILNFLKNHDHIVDEIRELCVSAINNRANDGHTLFPPTIE